MPRFYFDIIAPSGIRMDGEGDEYDSVAEARAQVSWFAEKIAGNMVDGATEVELRDEAGAVVATEFLPVNTTKH
jgi:glucose-6-phosphate dehydrogenase assembly protein OpcA